ncbi:phosphoserine phosphatase SerB [Pseudoroseicyclus aestuarii]|uniref:Phosphoserine phosphatase n=1 Tax=Pseudoroseicyclus aestuarii TaxID=1795041 RepID=A0A318SVC5_9RHOB|nr:phosphoserine phosphatase SerB [Pseudoroseicyclus aestuarii]PYE84309.1 phosphoserine phosphatase [Pseudoroseicyclus aestuarii]
MTQSQTAVLIAAPGALDMARVEALRAAWGGSALRLLSAGEAAEFDLSAAPADIEVQWQQMQEAGIDLAVLPTEGRRKRLLLADMDSTMIAQECIDELAAEAGVGPRVAEITARAMNAELNFEEALTERVALLEGLDEAVIARVLETRITLAPGGAVLVATMKAHGAHAALVSGGFTAFTGPVAARLGFDEHRANVLLAEEGKLTGRVQPPILGREAKVEALEEIAKGLGLTAQQVLAVGDGANDLGMLTRAGLGVALHAKPVVAAQARTRINHGDLTALLYLQGYRKDGFAGL